jgi:hypothetical protein
MAFNDWLQRAKAQPLQLYDVRTKRGWLVPELSAALCITHALAELPNAEPLRDGGESATKKKRDT